MKKGVDKSGMVYEVYYLGKSGKQIMVEMFDDQSDAAEHLKGLRKLYGKYIKAGIKIRKVTRLDQSMNKVKSAIGKRKVAFENVD